MKVIDSIIIVYMYAINSDFKTMVKNQDNRENCCISVKTLLHDQITKFIDNSGYYEMSFL